MGAVFAAKNGQIVHIALEGRAPQRVLPAGVVGNGIRPDGLNAICAAMISRLKGTSSAIGKTLLLFIAHVRARMQQ